VSNLPNGVDRRLFEMDRDWLLFFFRWHDQFQVMFITRLTF
jgi:hypothetical protein